MAKNEYKQFQAISLQKGAKKWGGCSCQRKWGTWKVCVQTGLIIITQVVMVFDRPEK